MPEFVFRDGQRLTPYMLYQIERLNADFKRIWGCEIKVTSGLRTYQEQVNIFLSRYVTAANINGRKVYDTRMWNGVRWYRISAAGTVAVPGYSNHEVQGTNGAVDLRDTGSGPGVAMGNNPRANWLKQHCEEYDLVAEGYGFREPWHFRARNIFKLVPGGGSGAGGVGKPITPQRRKKDNMTTAVVYTNDAADKDRTGAVVDLAHGVFEPFGWFPVSYADGLAVAWGNAKAAPVTRKHFDALKVAAAKKAEALGKVFVDIDDDDVPKLQLEE